MQSSRVRDLGVIIDNLSTLNIILMIYVDAHIFIFEIYVKVLICMMLVLLFLLLFMHLLVVDYIIAIPLCTSFRRINGSIANTWLQTTQPTSGGAVTADKNCCANCVEPSRPQQWGPDLPFFLGMPAMRTRWMAGAAAHKSG